MANRNLPFSINSLLTDHRPPQSPALQKAADLVECFPLIFGNSVNLPFGLAQLLGKKENEEEEEEEEEEMKMTKEEEEEEEEEEEGGRGGIVVEAKGKASPILRGANLPEQPIDSIQFPHPPPNGWLFPFSRALQANGPPAVPMPPSNHPFPRFPFLPPSFGSALAKSSLFPLFSPFPGICTGPSLPGHHQPPQNQHKRKGGQIRFSNEQTDTLENTFDTKRYLNNAERKRLAKSLGLSERQVKTWFQNRRAKWRRQAPADSDDLRSPEEEGVHAAEQQIHLAGTALATRPSAFFAAFPGLSD